MTVKEKREPTSLDYEKSSNKKLNVTIGLVLALMLQFAGVVWWASSLNAQVQDNAAQLNKGDRWTYQMAIAERDRNKEEHVRLTQAIDAVERRTGSVVREIKDAMLRLEVKLDKILVNR